MGAVLLAGTAFAASAVTNGSFETGVNPGFFLPLSVGNNTSINGWTVSAGQVDYIGNYWAASDGARSLDLTGSNGQPGAVSQTFATVAGHTYDVTFDLAGNPAGLPTIKTLNVDAGGTPTSYTFDTTGHTLTSMGWEPTTYIFAATSSSTTITFRSLDSGFYGPALDNVVVTDVLTNKDQCKNGGWQSYGVFKNQGDCVSNVATKGKNPPALL